MAISVTNVFSSWIENFITDFKGTIILSFLIQFILPNKVHIIILHTSVDKMKYFKLYFNLTNEIGIMSTRPILCITSFDKLKYFRKEKCSGVHRTWFWIKFKKKRRNANLLALSFCEFTTCRHAGDEDEVYCITDLCCRRLVSNRSPSVSH